MRCTRIHITLGPATSAAVVAELVQAGADGFRINAAHAGPADIVGLTELVRAVAYRAGRHVTVRLDTNGPRTRCSPNHGPILELQETARVVLGTDASADVRLTRDEFLTQLIPGHELLVDRGRITLTVVEVEPAGVVCEIGRGGVLTSNTPISGPATEASLKYVGRADARAIEAGSAAGVDIIALSLVRDGQDVRDVRALLSEVRLPPRVIAKIERAEALRNLPAILRRVDGISISRGDLGTVVAPEDRTEVLSDLVRRGRRSGKLVQVGGDVFRSWRQEGHPAWSESADIGFLVDLGIDGISLSEETAVGPDPVGAFSTLDAIVRACERRKASRCSEAAVATEDQALAMSRARRTAPIRILATQPAAGWLNAHWGVMPLVFEEVLV